MKLTDARVVTLKAHFNTGDQPTEANFADLIQWIQEGIEEHQHDSTGDGDGTGILNGPITVANGTWIGIGAALERIVFDAPGDRIALMGANFGVGTGTPSEKLEVSGRISVIGSQGWHAPVTEGFMYRSNLHGLVLTGKGTDYDVVFFSCAGGLIMGNETGTRFLRMDGVLKIKERAAAAGDTAAYGQLWVKNTTPCELWFTDDTGTDTQIV